MRVRVPGDKSLTQRALILAALAKGQSRLSGLLHGGDAESTADALRQLGVEVPPLPSDGSAILIRGVGLQGLAEPESWLDLGNSGTGARLMMGVLAGNDLTATIDGDASLRERPMARVTDPLAAMGAGVAFEDQEGRLPITLRGSCPLRPIDWPSPVASAQVKSAILLAGLTGRAFTQVTEPRRSRDHTERLFSAVGAPVISHAVAGGWRVELRDPPSVIAPLDFDVPGDISSAAFIIALGVLGGAGPEVTIERVGLNPTRSALLGVLERMGADVRVQPTGEALPEPLGEITARPSELRGTVVGPEEVPALIDEIPVIAVLAARAEGETRITGAQELRVKESDRISALVANLRVLGVEVEELSDGLVVRGTRRGLGGTVRSWGDHRIAMAFSVLGALDENAIEVQAAGVARVSFPGFDELVHHLVVGSYGR